MRRHRRHVKLLEALIVSVAVAQVTAAAAWLTANDYALLAAALIIISIGGGYAVFRVWRSRLKVVPYLELSELRTRVASTRATIWSFQISGGEFTRHLVADYEYWLSQDPRRKLKMLFANPENEGLLEGLVELSGMGKASTREDALRHLRETIKTSLSRYSQLQASRPEQVDLRVYDCSPPCSIHACDIEDGANSGSIFVEHYLPDLPWRDRPCFLINRHAPSFGLYVEHCSIWFKDSRAWKAPVAPDAISSR